MTATDAPTTTRSLTPAVRERGPLAATLRTTLNGVALVAPEAAARLAFELWRRPGRRGQVHASERPVHETARVSIVEHQGRRVVTYAWGDGRRPVLLVHGWRSRASRFADLVAALLEQGYSPVSYDAPGHGSTGGRAGTILDHRAIIGALAQQHGTFDGVVAHSLGVPFALYAVRDGVTTGRVVAVSGIGEFGYLVDAFCAGLGLRGSLNQRLRRTIERSLFDSDTGIWERFSVRRAADCELLVVHNDVDRVAERGQADLLVATYGHRARLIETTGLGHSRILRDAEVIRATVAFLGAEAAAA